DHVLPPKPAEHQYRTAHQSDVARRVRSRVGPPRTGRPPAMRGPLRSAAGEVGLPFALVGALFVVGYIVQAATGKSFMHPVSFAFTSTFLPLVFLCFLYGSAWALVGARTALPPEKRSWPAAWARAREGSGPLSGERVAALTASAGVIALLFATF